MNRLYRKVYPLYHIYYTVCGKIIIQFVAILLYNLWICLLWKCILSHRKTYEVPRLQYVKYKSAIEVNFIAFGLHCLGAVRKRKSGIGMLLRNSYTAYIQRSKLYWIATLSD